MMYWKSLTAFILLQTLVVSNTSAQHAGELLKDLELAFNRHLANPAQYSQRVKAECSIFPEGALFPYSLVALSWCHKIYRSPGSASTELPKIEKLLEMALGSSARVVRPPAGRFSELTTVGEQGVYVSQLAMALAAYRLAGGKRPDLIETENRLNAILVKALVSRGGKPIISNPGGEIWPFDTGIALFAVELHDRVAGSRNLPPLLQQHQSWILRHGTDSSTGLPASEVLGNGQLVPSRGCDLAWRLALWSQMDPSQSSKWYRNFRARYWKSSRLAKGFREWSHDKIKVVDLDSGPVLFGVGGTATVLGVCTAVAHSDRETVAVLCQQANVLNAARTRKDIISNAKIKTIYGGLHKIGIKTSRQYITGFLYGDVTTFYAMSWRPYPSKPIR